MGSPEGKVHAWVYNTAEDEELPRGTRTLSAFYTMHSRTRSQEMRGLDKASAMSHSAWMGTASEPAMTEPQVSTSLHPLYGTQQPSPS